MESRKRLRDKSWEEFVEIHSVYRKVLPFLSSTNIEDCCRQVGEYPGAYFSILDFSQESNDFVHQFVKGMGVKDISCFFSRLTCYVFDHEDGEDVETNDVDVIVSTKENVSNFVHHM